MTSAQPKPPALTPMQEIVEWCGAIPLWQRDALRRLCVRGSLTEDDLAECTTFCLQQHQKDGIPDNAKKPDSLTSGHVRVDGAGNSVGLKSVKDVANVNALADGQALRFRESGLTAVFGGNGSGKSGYARVLKKACRARVTSSAILPNVYLPKPKTSATAVIEYWAAGKTASANWTDGIATDEALSSISVFDSACAVAHVERTNDVAYTPTALELLARLAETCREVKRRLGLEQQNVEGTASQTLAAKSHAQTKVGKMLANLSATSMIASYDALSVLNDDEKKRLETLRSDLANDPRKLVEQHRLRKQRLAGIISKAVALNTVVWETAAEQFKQQFGDAVAKAEAARLAANVLFKKEPLANIGSETWRALWDAARKYSEAEAYHGQIFPVTVAGGRCVLCQQELDEDARGRLSRFETFVKENAQKAALEAKQLVERTRTTLRTANFTGEEQADALG